MRDIFAVQTFTADVWRTIFLTTYQADADDTYDAAVEVTDDPLRLVRFGVTNLDFVAIHARDFAVVEGPTGGR